MFTLFFPVLMYFQVSVAKKYKLNIKHLFFTFFFFEKLNVLETTSAEAAAVPATTTATVTLKVFLNKVL